jgi:hypothetical protein
MSRQRWTLRIHPVYSLKMKSYILGPQGPGMTRILVKQEEDILELAGLMDG